MKFLFLVMLALQLFAAQSGVYVGGGAGVNFSDKLEFENGHYVYNQSYPYNLALGYQSNLWRFEAEGMYTKSKITNYSSLDTTTKASGDLMKQSGLFNIGYSGYNKTKMVSTITVGAGVSNISAKSPSIDASANSVLTYRASFAAGYMVDSHLTLETKYTYLATQSFTIADVAYKGLRDNLLSLNLRYLF
jgi:hypothetical protein